MKLQKAEPKGRVRETPEGDRSSLGFPRGVHAGGPGPQLKGAGFPRREGELAAPRTRESLPGASSASRQASQRGPGVWGLACYVYQEALDPKFPRGANTHSSSSFISDELSPSRSRCLWPLSGTSWGANPQRGEGSLEDGRAGLIHPYSRENCPTGCTWLSVGRVEDSKDECAASVTWRRAPTNHLTLFSPHLRSGYGGAVRISLERLCVVILWYKSALRGQAHFPSQVLTRPFRAQTRMALKLHPAQDLRGRAVKRTGSGAAQGPRCKPIPAAEQMCDLERVASRRLGFFKMHALDIIVEN